MVCMGQHPCAYQIRLEESTCDSCLNNTQQMCEQLQSAFYSWCLHFPSTWDGIKLHCSLSGAGLILPRVCVET